jgi:hypothetical protein
MKRMAIAGIALLLLLTVVGIVMSSRKARGPSTFSLGQRSGSSDDILPTVRGILQNGSGVQASRTAIQQLNTYIDRNPGKKPEPVADPEKIRKQFGLSDDEFGEINSSTFTQLDAYYIDYCLMLRDAAYSLGVAGQPPLERAKSVFGWVIRQIQLREPSRPIPMLPTEFVLRRGWGTSLERALAFLAMLQQVEVPGCMLAYREAAADPRLTYWIPGALIDREIYLFDTRMGIPLPAPEGDGIASLRQVRTHPKPFASLALDEKHSYDVTAEQAQRAEILLTLPLSALAPRMKLLDTALAGRQKLRASGDWVTLRQEFETATAGQRIPIRFWGESGDPAAPTRILRTFLPPQEGGTDRFGIMALMNRTLVPGFALPAVIQQQEATGDFGNLLAGVFWSPFREFYLDPRGPREMVVRGQLDESGARLTQAPVILRLREALLGMLAPLSDKEVEWVRNGTLHLSLEGLEQIEVPPPDLAQVAKWCDRAFIAYRHYVESRDPAAREEAVRVFIDGEPDLNNLLLASVKRLLLAETNYQIAICFHEKAVRQGAAKGAWKTAAAKWDKYLNPSIDYPKFGMSQARLLRAEALRKQGDIPGAVAELEKPSPGLTNLEATARLFQIRQLQKLAAAR